jgi:cell division protease FtsH
VRRQHEKALKILRENNRKLDEIAEYLYFKETITGDEFMDILNRKPEPRRIGTAAEGVPEETEQPLSEEQTADEEQGVPEEQAAPEEQGVSQEQTASEGQSSPAPEE